MAGFTRSDISDFLKQIPGVTAQTKILVAVSGGIDSMVLTHALLTCGYHIGMAHVNFLLRGAESDGDEQFVLQQAALSSTPVFHMRADAASIAKQKGQSIEEAARHIRYDWLEQIRVENSYDVIATAHHLNDHAETMLMHLTTGTGLQGMQGIRVRNGNVIRPLLFATKAQIISYASQHEVPYRIDASNNSDQYLRNKFRLQLIPILQEVNPQFLHTMATNAKHFSEEHLLAQERAKQLIDRWERINGSIISIPIKPLRTHPAAETLMHTWLSPYGFNGAQIHELATQDFTSGKQLLSPTHRIIIDRKHFLLTSRDNAIADIISIEKGDKKIVYPAGILEVEHMPMHPDIRINSIADVLHIDADLVEWPLALRIWRKGDYLYPLGMHKKNSNKPGKKKVSDVLSDARVSIPLKERTFVLTNKDHIIWILGIRSDDRFKVSRKTTNIIKIKMLPD